jgi:hypothetical protein
MTRDGRHGSMPDVGVTARARRRTIALLIALFVVAFVYRFNGLGGVLGGFDDDHFMYYVRARQVAHGERPLRDFADAGVQGAWPALTYELPALAQKWGGETLLSEGVLTAAGIALSLTLLFRVAAQYAGTMPAVAVTLLTLFIGSKLYAYPKLLTFSVAAALLARYARAPTAGAAALLAIWSVVAFLFRHDFFVYLIPPVAIAIVVGSGPWRVAWRRLLVYAIVVGALIVGPLYSIHRYVGIGRYVQTGLTLSQREAERTDIGWPRFAPAGVTEFFRDEQNAAAWLYYLCLLIPVVAIVRAMRWPVTAGIDAHQRRVYICALGVLAIVLDWFFLRGNLPARLGDLGAPVSVLGASLLASRPGATGSRAMLARAAAVILLIPTILAVDTIGSVRHELETTGLTAGPGKIAERTVSVIRQLRALPPPAEGDPAAGVPNVAEYLRACTASSDRVLMFSSTPAILAMSARAFAAGHPTFTPGFYTSADDQRLMLVRLRGQSVPVVVTEPEATYLEDLAPEFPLLHDYVTTWYESAGELPAHGEHSMRLLVRRGLQPRREYGATGLPCFR